MTWVSVTAVLNSGSRQGDIFSLCTGAEQEIALLPAWMEIGAERGVPLG